MAGVCWTAVMLAFFLSTENVAAVNQNTLATIVNGILREYGTKGMFSLAVRIPNNQNQNINQRLQEVFTTDPANNVKNTINNNEVYIGSRVVAAKVLKRDRGADHAESRVVDYLDQLFNKRNDNDHDLLLFYVYASPCVEKCTSDTHRANILDRINHIRKWADYAVVFSTIFKPRFGQGNSEEELSEALQRLGTHRGSRGPIGLGNIFRCKREDRWMQCSSCSSDNQVARHCVSDDTQPDTSQSQTPTPTPTQPQQGSDDTQTGLHVDNGNVNNDVNTNEDVASSQTSPDNDNGDNVNTNEGVSSSQSDHDNGSRLTGGKGKGRGVNRRKGKGKGRGVNRRKGKGKGRGVNRRKGKGRGVNRRKGKGKGRGVNRRKGKGKGRGVNRRKGKGRGVNRRKGKGKGRGVKI